MCDFDSWATYYDLVHQGLPGEAEFYVGLAVKRGAPVLDVGCGTGRITIPMAMSGLHVTGLDNSPGMLAVCQEKSAQIGPMTGTIDLVEADMRRFALSQRFPLVLMTYRTFMHCLTPAEQVDCLACIFEHLEPGGELFCNVWAANPRVLMGFPTSCPEEDLVLLSTFPIPDEDIVVEHYYTGWRDDFRQLIHERHYMQEKNAAGDALEEECLTMTRAWLTPREMEHLVARTGFEIVEVLGDFEGAPLSPEHKEMVWRLRRPKES